MIKDLEQGRRMLEQIEGFLKRLENLIKLVEQGDYLAFNTKGGQLLKAFEETYEQMILFKEEETSLATPIMCECIIESLRYVLKLAIARSKKTIEKIKFEVIPLVEELYAHFYFKGCIEGDYEKKKHYLEDDKPEFYKNKYLEKAKETGEYAYELSIIVVAYNKLEITKQCIESLFSYIPKDLSYELILINHGSTDGTRAYFESLSPTKQLDFHKNGGGMHAVHRIVEGRYQLIVSNDVLVTENAIANMLACIKSDEKIQWVVPSTPHISNLQSIASDYTSVEEMYQFASQNNVLDPYRWEQRARLCDPIAMSKDVWEILSHNSYFDNWLGFSFPDDRISLALRRKGYKMMLAKDAYCYHYGSLTLENEINAYKDEKGNEGSYAFYLEGRKRFYEECGIDPWGTGFCWSFEMLRLVPCNLTGHIDILGINCGIGSNSLKIKDYIKELAHNTDVTLYNVTDDLRYILDLQGISDKCQYVSSLMTLPKVLGGVPFKYILFEDRLEQYEDPCKMIENIMIHLLEEDGLCVFCLSAENLKEEMKNKYPNLKTIGDWHTLTRREIE